MLLTLLATLSLAPAPMVTLSVDGNGYLQFAQPDRALYTSSAPLTVVDGMLAYPNGAPLLPILRVPDGTIRVDVDKDGDVFAATRTFRGRVGRLSLATFSPGADLRPYGSFLVSSAMPKYKEPGDDNVGTIHVVKPGDPIPEMKIPTPAEHVENESISATDDFVQSWINRRPEETDPVTTLHSGAAHISIASESDIDSSTFTLGDLGVIDADPELRQALMNVHIGDTPKPAKKLNVRRDTILRRLESQGFDTSDFKIDIPRHAFVVRHGQKASEDQITSMAIKAAEQVCGERDLKASLHMETDYAPEGNIDYEVESCTPTPRGAVVIVVTKVDGQRYNSHVVRIATGG